MVIGSPVFGWTPASNFKVTQYRIEYRRLGTSLATMPQYETAGTVPAPITRLAAPHALAPGEYAWHVRVIGTPPPGFPSSFASTEAAFIVVAPEFQGSDIVMGVAYTQAEQWDRAEARFRHLMRPQAGEASGAAEARLAAGSKLLRWLQRQRHSTGKSASAK